MSFLDGRDMKTDQEVKLMRQERLKGKRQDQAAAGLE